MPESSEGDGAVPARAASLKRPCGCVSSPITRETAHLIREDPCLRKAVEADLAGVPRPDPLCPDATCPHHAPAGPDAFRRGWAWSESYHALKEKLRDEAMVRARAMVPASLPAATSARPTRSRSRPSDVLVGVKAIGRALRDAGLRISTEDINAALKAGDIPGAFQDMNHPRHAWTVGLPAALAWSREWSRKEPPTPSR